MYQQIPLPIFEYCSIEDLRDEGLSISSTTDIRAKKLIRRSSAKINVFTDQWFYPIKIIADLDGSDSQILRFTNSIPFIKINSINILSNNSTINRTPGYAKLRNRNIFGLLTTGSYSISDDRRTLELTSSAFSQNDINISNSSGTKIFPIGRRNVVTDGVFGYIENVKDISVLTTTQINVNDISVDVSDVSNLEENDILIFNIANKLYYKILKTIVGNTLTFESSEFIAGVGTQVLSFGRIPELIKYCCIKLSILSSIKIGDIVSGASTDPIIMSALISEKTDQYQYKLSENSVENISTGYIKGSTGDGEVDRILQEFVSPSYSGSI